jgi:hypothetical protein
MFLGFGPLKRPKVMEILIAFVNDLSPVLVFDKGGVCSTLLYSTLLYFNGTFTLDVQKNT